MDSRFSRETPLRWLLALGCFAVLIFFFSPSWGAFILWSRVPEMSGMIEVRRGASVLAQVAHPGAAVADPLHRVIQWRLLFPVVGNVLGLSGPFLFGLADAGCVLVLGYIVSLARRSRFTWTETGLATLALGAGSWFFVSTGWLGYYDSWVALGLLVAAFSRRPWTMWLACAWAPWVDERFVLAVPVALLCRWMRESSPSSGRDTAPRPNRRLEYGVAAALVAGYVGVRLGILPRFSDTGATIGGYFSGKEFLAAPLGRIALGIWDGLRAGWFFVAAAVWLLRSRPVHSALLGTGVFLTVSAGIGTAQDYSRSMTMLLPVAVYGLLLIGARPAARRRAVAGARNPETESSPASEPAPGATGHGAPIGAREPDAETAVPQTGTAGREAPLAPTVAPARRAVFLGAAAAAALLLPAHHVMSDRVNPIFYLYHEIAAIESPPPVAMPELHELRAVQAMQRGDLTQTMSELDLAIRLSRHPVFAAKQRGMIYATQRRWREARRDFSTVVANDPGDPDGWFLRSQVELAMGESIDARRDFDRARSIAPPGWESRPDVARFSALLDRQTGRPSPE